MFKRTEIIPSTYKIGDKVQCIRLDNLVNINLFDIYTVENIDTLGIKLVETDSWYINNRFKNVTRKLKMERVLKCSK